MPLHGVKIATYCVCSEVPGKMLRHRALKRRSLRECPAVLIIQCMILAAVPAPVSPDRTRRGMTGPTGNTRKAPRR